MIGRPPGRVHGFVVGVVKAVVPKWVHGKVYWIVALQGLEG